MDKAKITAAFAEASATHPGAVDKLHRAIHDKRPEVEMTRAEWEALGKALRRQGVALQLRELGITKITLTDTAPMSDAEIARCLGCRVEEIAGPAEAPE